MNVRQTNAAKGIAILCMVFHHLFYRASRYTTYGLTGLIISQDVTYTIANDMKVCVAIFAFLSGFGMVMKTRAAAESQPKLTPAWFARNAAESYLKLVRDTFFLMAIIIPLSVILHLERSPAAVWNPKGEADTGRIILGVLTNMSGTAGFFGYGWFIRAWWYLKIAILFILCFPLLYLILTKLRKTGWILLLAFSVFAVPMVLGLNVKRDQIWRYLPAFLSGMILADKNVIGGISGWTGEKRIRKIMLGSTLLVLLAASVVIRHNTSRLQYVIQSFQAIIIFLAVVFFIPKLPGIYPMLVVLGKNSKYMWLIHTYIFGQLMMEWLFSMRNIWLIYGFLVVLTLAVSAVLRKLCERIFSFRLFHIRPRAFPGHGREG